LGAALAACSFAGNASAHGGNPRAYNILFDPMDPNNAYLHLDFWGSFYSTDAQKTWSYGCSELWGVHSTDTVPTNQVLNGGRLLVAAGFQGLLVTEDHCTWTRVTGLKGQVPDVELTKQGNLVALTVSNEDGGETTNGGVFQSTDNGDTWKPLGSNLPHDFSGVSVAVAPSDPTRIYVSGAVIGGAGIVFERSTDTGATWKRTVIDVPNLDPNTFWDPRIRLVQPTNPDVIFLWIDGEEGLGTYYSDQIWLSTDGGQHFASFFVGTGDLPGFALSPDGTTLAISGPGSPDPTTGLTNPDGLNTASFTDALAHGQSAFQKVYDQQVWGLNWTTSGLYAGNNDFTNGGIPEPFTFGVSQDGGHSFKKIMNLCEVKFPACAATSTAQVCVTPVDSQSTGQGGYQYDFLGSDRCTNPPPSARGDGGVPTGGSHTDAGSPTTTPPAGGGGGGKSSGCAVSSPGSSLGTGWLAAFGLGMVGLFALRSRRRR
jgi:MYXO-CTERM domain-containing protein